MAHMGLSATIPIVEALWSRISFEEAYMAYMAYMSLYGLYEPYTVHMGLYGLYGLYEPI